MKTLLLRQPAADVAPVVRCKDCIYRIEGRCFSRTSFLNAPAVEPDNFCSWGATEWAGWREYDVQSGVTICYPKLAIVCTNCRCAFKKDTLWSRNYCPNYGAKVDGGFDDATS